MGMLYLYLLLFTGYLYDGQIKTHQGICGARIINFGMCPNTVMFFKSEKQLIVIRLPEKLAYLRKAI